MKNTLWIYGFILLTSCNGQPPSNQVLSNEAGQSPRIIRTQGTQSGVVGCELLDRDGNLWFSISGEGAYRYDGKQFTNFSAKDGLCNNNVGSIIQDKAGNILFGTNSGICRYDGMEFTKFPAPDTLSITAMLEDKNGNLWFGTTANGVFRYNGKTLDNFLNSKRQEYNLGSDSQFILDIMQDSKGNLWFSSWNGGGVWKYDGQIFENFLPSPEYYKANQDKREFANSGDFFDNTSIQLYTPSKDHISDDMIFSTTEDNFGNIWFATRDHGVCRFDGETFTTIGKKEGFNSRGATGILQLDNNDYWITTVDSGVWLYDGRNFKNFTEQNGLVNNAVMCLLKDKQDHLWFGTKYLGLSRYDGKTFTTFSYFED